MIAQSDEPPLTVEQFLAQYEIFFEGGGALGRDERQPLSLWDIGNETISSKLPCTEKLFQKSGVLSKLHQRLPLLLVMVSMLMLLIVVGVVSLRGIDSHGEEPDLPQPGDVSLQWSIGNTAHNIFMTIAPQHPARIQDEEPLPMDIKHEEMMALIAEYQLRETIASIAQGDYASENSYSAAAQSPFHRHYTRQGRAGIHHK